MLTGTLSAVLWRRLPPTVVDSSRSYRRLVSGLPGLYRAHRVLRQRAVLALAIFATFNVLWTPLALELAGRPHRLSPTAIGLFGLVGIAGALGARQAGRLADRGHGRTASGAALALMLAGWLPIALAGWALPALVAGMVLVDVAVQTVHVVSQSQVTAVDLRARSSLVAAYMVCYTVGSAAGAAASTAVHAAHGWAAVAILGAAISGAGLVYWAASTPGDGAACAHCTEDDRIARSAAIVPASQRANARSGFRVLGSCMSFHQAPQPDQPIPDSRLGGSERNSEVFGDLDVGQTVEVDQFEGVVAGRRSTRSTPGVLDRGRMNRSRHPKGCRPRPPERGVAALTVAPRLLGTHTVNRPSMSDRHGPATHPTTSRVETGRLAPQLDEDLLGDLLGLGGVTHHAPHDAVHRGRQLVIELGERSLVAPRDPSHQGSRVSVHAARTTTSNNRLIASSPVARPMGRTPASDMWAMFEAASTDGSVHADLALTAQNRVPSAGRKSTRTLTTVRRRRGRVGRYRRVPQTPPGLRHRPRHRRTWRNRPRRRPATRE